MGFAQQFEKLRVLPGAAKGFCLPLWSGGGAAGASLWRQAKPLRGTWQNPHCIQNFGQNPKEFFQNFGGILNPYAIKMRVYSAEKRYWILTWDFSVAVFLGGEGGFFFIFIFFHYMGGGRLKYQIFLLRNIWTAPNKINCYFLFIRPSGIIFYPKISKRKVPDIYHFILLKD